MIDVEEVLENLVKCNTIKDKENSKIIDYIEKTLLSIGFKTEFKDKVLIMSNKEDAQIGFVGHTDTVNYTEGWEYPKFEITKENGKLYGLGICDMKSGIAAMISAVSSLDEETLNKGIKFYITYDEEIGFSGIKEIVEYEKVFPKTIIIGEPTNNEFIVGSKGLIEYKISLDGIKTHSSTPDKGESAILKAVGFINELNEFYEIIKKQKSSEFEVPYTSMNIGKIMGGIEINSVPDYCEFLLDFRTINKEIEQVIINKIDELKEKYNAKVELLNRISAFINPNKYSNKTCNFITEASFLENERIILGAGPVTAHEINEYIEEESLKKLVEQYIKIMKDEKDI